MTRANQNSIHTADGIPPEQNTLLLTENPNHDEQERRWIVDASTPSETSIVLVTSTDPVDVLSEWKGLSAELPADIAIIQVSDVDGKGKEGLPSLPDTTFQTTRVAPSDLTGLGVAINQALAWAADRQATVNVRFDPFTTLLQFNDPERVFRFLHTMTNRTSAIDATAGFHLLTTPYDDQTVATFYPLFDDIQQTAQPNRSAATHAEHPRP